MKGIRVAMVTNIPAPYRLPIYERLVKYEDMDLCVFFCSGREPDREWDLHSSPVPQVYFREKFITYKNRFIHLNPDAWSALARFRPEVVITTGFNPTFLVAFAYARVHGVRHIAMTDGTDHTESFLTAVHRWVRRRVYAGSQAFIGASEGSFRLYDSYRIPRSKMFQSHLCANNALYQPLPLANKTFDFVYSARFVPGKNPVFALDVAAGVARKLGRRTRILLLGSGELQAEMNERAQALVNDVEVVFAGFVKQAELPGHYASARLFLFPTQIDTWGVVANEACAAGLPVLVTPMAGVADDLVQDGMNGHVLPLELEAWTDAATRLLQDDTLYERYAGASLRLVERFNYDNAADGIRRAVLHATGRGTA